MVVDENSLLKDLRADYDQAFRNWASQVRVLQSVSSDDPRDQEAIQQARLWVEEAAAVYREKREMYLKFMLAGSQEQAQGAQANSGDAKPLDFQQPSSPPQERAHQVQRLARQIWEESGRPADTAEADWYKAEEILDTRR